MTGETREKQKKKKKNQVPFRLNILFIIVFLLFSILILQLGIVQIVNGQQYKEKVQNTQTKTSKLNAARGLIYDRNGTLLAGNQPKKAITFTRTNYDSSEDLLNLAKKLSHYITMDTNDLTETDMKNYWVAKQGLTKAFDEKLSKSEYNKLVDQDNKAYDLLLKRVSNKDMASLDKHDRQVAAIYFKLSQAMNLTPFYVKVGLSDQAFFRIGEHLDQLPGIHLTMASSRVYPNGHPFYLGYVNHIPQGKLDYYRVRGYNNNDKVGTSYLEQYYEGVLNGVPTKLVYQTDQGDNAVGDPKKMEGRRGDSLVLTINYQFQQKVQHILKNELKRAMSQGGNPHLNSAYAVVVNPNTGGILSMNGVAYENGEFQNVSYQAVTGSFAVGSTVKGATELAGFMTGTIPSSFNDMPMYGGGIHHFSSYTGNSIGTVTPETALEASSNVFMGKIAANMAGIQLRNVGSHYEGAYIPPADSPKVIHAFRTLRNVYAQVGLGVKTGIDLPSEGLGYEGSIPPPQTGQILRYAIGQYDTYTPLMVAQYMATIANGGYRMQLHLLKSVRAPSIKQGTVGKVLYQYEPHVLDHITMSQHYLDRIHRGFWLVTHGSYHETAGKLAEPPYAKYDIAGKTGTADVNLSHDRHTVNELFSGYAPAGSGEEPQIAFTVIFPGLDNAHVGGDPYKIEYHTETAGKIVQAYFDMTGGIQ
ncbi:MAG TPA: penicillin-binding protein 2 [Bacillales bacterium]|nr:penicillin-binding protein 2 [Bacillales bacterium]